MNAIPSGARVTAARLREALQLPRVRPEGVRDVLVVPCAEGDLLPCGLAHGPLALGDMPEDWRRDPASGPRYLVALRGLARPYRIAGVWETDPGRWGADTRADPQRRAVPLLSPAYIASAMVTGALLDAPLVFGWLDREEQYAFL